VALMAAEASPAPAGGGARPPAAALRTPPQGAQPARGGTAAPLAGAPDGPAAHGTNARFESDLARNNGAIGLAPGSLPDRHQHNRDLEALSPSLLSGDTPLGKDSLDTCYSDAAEFQSARRMCRGQRDQLGKFSVREASGIWASLRAQGEREGPRADYLEAHIACAQREGRSDAMEYFMRAILMGWLGELAAAMKLQRETLFLAVNLVDRFLSQEPRFPRRQLQLLGCSAMLLAAKMEEVYVPPLDQFAAYTAEDGSDPEDIKATEMRVLRALDYGLHCPTVATFLGVAVSALFKEQTPCSCLAYLLAELASLEYRFLAFPAAMLAAACLAAAQVLNRGLKEFGAPPAGGVGAAAWGKDLEELTGYSRAELALCVDHLLCFHARARAHVAALERAGVQLDAPDPVQHVFGKYRSKRAHGAGHVRAHFGGLQPPAGQPLGVGRLRAYADENLGCPGHRMAAYWTTRMAAGR